MKCPLLCVKRGLCNCFWVWSKSAHPGGLKPWPSPCKTCSGRMQSPPSPGVGGGVQIGHQASVSSIEYGLAGTCLSFPVGNRSGRKPPQPFWGACKLNLHCLCDDPWQLFPGFPELFWVVSLCLRAKLENMKHILFCPAGWAFLKESKAARPKGREERCLDSNLEQTAPRESLGGQGSVVVCLLGKLWDKWYMDVYVSWHSSL